MVFIIPGERAMSPAQSEDSGLAADRSTYATISLPRENAQAMGIVFLGKSKKNSIYAFQLQFLHMQNEHKRLLFSYF